MQSMKWIGNRVILPLQNYPVLVSNVEVTIMELTYKLSNIVGTPA